MHRVYPTSIVVCSLVAWVSLSNSSHAEAVFFGEDINTTATGNNEDAVRIPHPTADVAHAAFVAFLQGVATETFEGLAPNSTATTLTFGSDTATLSPPLTVLNQPTGTMNGTYPISGDQFLLQSFGPPNTFAIDFSAPQAAFGFYATDLDVAGNLSLRFLLADGVSTIDRPVPSQAQGAFPNNNTGSVVYFGVIDTANPFTRVSFIRSLNQNDGFGFDDMTIGTVQAVAPSDFVLEVEYQTPESTGPLIDGFDPLPETITARFTLGDVQPGQTTIGLDQVLSFDLGIPGNHPNRADLDSFQLSLNSNGSPQGLTWGVNAFGMEPKIILNTNFMLEITGTDPATEDEFRYFWSTSTNTFTPAPGLTGDYNADDTVNAADYVVWRKFQGTDVVLPNDPLDGDIGQMQYDNWRGKFGNTAASGATGSASASIIPEPSPAAMLIPLMGLLVFIRVSERRGHSSER